MVSMAGGSGNIPMGPYAKKAVSSLERLLKDARL
jgi:hypothetical protein